MLEKQNMSLHMLLLLVVRIRHWVHTYSHRWRDTTEKKLEVAVGKSGTRA